MSVNIYKGMEGVGVKKKKQTQESVSQASTTVFDAD